LGEELADYQRETGELNDLVAEREREIAQLQDDLGWERARVRQLEGLDPTPA
jgi:hypothetical protein